MKPQPLLIILLFVLNLNAQISENVNTMLWTTLGVNKTISDKFSVSYNQLNSYSISDSRINFIQTDLDIGYEINKKWDATVSYTPTFSLDSISDNQLIYHRISAEIGYKSKLGKRFRLTNSITAMHHFTAQSKFKQRYYYALELYYRDTKLPWKLRPFVNQRLYWYANGKDLQYYDLNGNKTELVPPDGLHAYRLMTGIKFYPFKDFSFFVYYQKQKEFNTTFLGSRDINSLNPRTNNIRRPFYDFSVIGISCIYKL